MIITVILDIGGVDFRGTARLPNPEGATEADLERACRVAVEAAAKAVRDCAVGIAAAQDLPKEVGDA